MEKTWSKYVSNLAIFAKNNSRKSKIRQIIFDFDFCGKVPENQKLQPGTEDLFFEPGVN